MFISLETKDTAQVSVRFLHVKFEKILTSNAVDLLASTHMAVSGARSARDVVATLNAGFTSVRELSGYGVQLAQVSISLSE